VLISGVEPLVIFLIFVSVLTLSPGFILSGLYQQKKSLLKVRPDISSRIGTQTSSVHPGKTVDSYTIMSPFLRAPATVSVALIIGMRFGRFTSSIGVGTVIIKI
jgi:hypothetical protein